MSEGLDPCVVLAATTRFSVLFALLILFFEYEVVPETTNETTNDESAMAYDFYVAYFVNLLGYTFQCIGAISVLNNVQPLSYSIANIAKRICVIVASIIFFQNKVSATNAVGMTITLIAVGYYNIIQTFDKISTQRVKREASSRSIVV